MGKTRSNFFPPDEISGRMMAAPKISSSRYCREVKRGSIDGANSCVTRKPGRVATRLSLVTARKNGQIFVRIGVAWGMPGEPPTHRGRVLYA